MALTSTFLQIVLIAVFCGYISSKQSIKQLNNSTLTFKEAEPIHEQHSNVSANTSSQSTEWSNSNTDSQCDINLNNVVICNADTLNIQVCYCVHYDEELNKLIIGYCLFTCYLPQQKLYYTIKRGSNGTLINKQMCKGEMLGPDVELHRSGRLCGRCEPGYGLPVYSYHFFQCMKCPQPSYKNWLHYFAIALVPLTIFYFIVIIFEINAMSGRLSMYVFYCQVASMPVQMRLFTRAVEALDRSTAKKRFSYLILSLYGIWNLDFFRTLYPPFCIDSNMTVLQIIALDYIIAVYPILLTIITYVFILLKQNTCMNANFLFRPMHWCFRSFRRHWNMQNSLIKAFATFLLLSYVKLLGVSFDLLVPTHIFKLNGNNSTTLNFKLQFPYLYYDATVEMFGPDHLPYAILACFVLVFFILCPLVLFCLYPCQCFQKLLNLCGHRCQALHTFMDVYTGLYRHEPHDWRYFAALHILGRIFSLIAFDILLSLYVVPVIAFVAVIGALLIAIVQPKKSATHNTIDIVCLLAMASGYLAFTAIIFASYVSPGASERFVTTSIAMIAISLPVFYPVLYFFRYIYRKVKRMTASIRRATLPRCLRRHDSVDSLPDRMVNEEDYPPLLPPHETAQNNYNGCTASKLMGQLPSSHSATNNTY